MSRPSRGMGVNNPISEMRSTFSDGETATEFLNRFYYVARKTPLYKRVKYVSIYKYYQSKTTTSAHGVPMTVRVYMVAILTDDNHLYVNKYKSRQSFISHETTRNLEAVLLGGYVYDKDTTILLSDNIGEKYEPMYTFIHIVAKTIGTKLVRRSAFTMLATLNNRLHLGVKLKKAASNGSVGTIKKRLIERGYFEFVPQEMIEYMTKQVESQKFARRATFYACLGILFLFRIGILAEYKNRSTNTKPSYTSRLVDEYIAQEIANETE